MSAERSGWGRVLVFGGTVEGRQLSDALVSGGILHTVSVATEYGEEVLEPSSLRIVHRGRMDGPEMEEFFQTGGFEVVVDATHPYAVAVSENIRGACRNAALPYLRYLRAGAMNQEEQTENEVWVGSAREAAEYLETVEGRIFLTTGSKELSVFTGIISDRSRLFARVLPSAQVMADCRGLGLEGKQICGMQGPFSQEMNEAMLRQTQAAFLVTKNTGASGGFDEKRRAARALGIRCVIIRRPEETGYTLEEALRRLEELLHISGGLADAEASDQTLCQGSGSAADSEVLPVSVSCIGIGMGDVGTMTREAACAIREADILFGASRILRSVKPLFENGSAPDMVEEYVGERIAAYLRSHPGYRRAAILMSGDVGFYSGARGIAAAFPDVQVRYYCGISSVVYFASKIPTAWQDARLLSAHGKEIRLLNCVQRYPKMILLVSGAGDVERLCRELTEAGMDQVKVTVGCNLSYPDETIRSGSPADFASCQTRGLHIMLLENPDARHIVTPGIADEAFVRGKVPMTKEEIRILSVAKLRLTEDAVVWDVGAGTGSVSAECARLCTSGTVYAVERNAEGVSLIRENSRRLRLSNVIAVEGEAPEALEALPAPTHVFIGGSSGNMKEILAAVREKNRDARIVINTVTLESIAEVTHLLAEVGEDADIVQISAAKARTLGRYHLMTAQNPVYIVSFGGR